MIIIAVCAFDTVSERSAHKVENYNGVIKIRLPDCFRNHHSEFLDLRLPAYDRGSNLRSYHFSRMLWFSIAVRIFLNKARFYRGNTEYKAEPMGNKNYYMAYLCKSAVL